MIRTISTLALVCATTLAHAAPFNPFAPPGAAPAAPTTTTTAPVPTAPPPPPEPVGPTERVEHIPVVRLGKVNGDYVYRGTGAKTYLFSDKDELPLVRKPRLTPMPADPLDEQNASSADRPALPSMVGARSQAGAPPIPNAPSVDRPSPSVAKKP